MFLNLEEFDDVEYASSTKSLVLEVIILSITILILRTTTVLNC